MRFLTATALFAAIACSGPGLDPAPDARGTADAGADLDAHPCPTPAPTPDRIASYSRVCRDAGPSSQACPGASDLTYPACEFECRAGVAAIGWCPR